MLLLTAYTKSFAPAGEQAVESIARYCRRTDTRFHSIIIPDDYPKPPSWFKIKLIREALAEEDMVLWVDSDALIVDTVGSFEDILKPTTLNISKDENGINCGVMAWKSCDQAIDALHQIDNMYEEYKDNKWWEQAALMSFIDTLEVAYQPKEVFNSYTNDFCPSTRIVHFPGFSLEDKVILMQAQNIGIRRNGHGGGHFQD